MKTCTGSIMLFILLTLQSSFCSIQDTRIILDSTYVEIKNGRSGKAWTIRILDICSPGDKDHSRIVLSENRYIKLKKYKARILDMQGKVLKKLDEKDVQKLNVSPGFLLYDDAKYHILDLRYPQLPYRIELLYEKEFESLLFCPSWLPLEDIPVSRSVFELAVAPQVEFKTYDINLDIAPETSKNDGMEVYKWKATDLDARIQEPSVPGWSNPQMGLLTIPKVFELDDTKGSTDSWQELGKWSRDLFQNRFDLSSASRAHVENLVIDCPTEIQKINVLYRFLQKHTRYVGIQLGLSGWQPQLAQQVLDNQYGDCKDLSTLMVAMLRHCGIEAFPALVNSERQKIFTSFPALQFNHVLVCVPTPFDTVWLECTSDYLPPGDLSPSCEQADVLLIKSDGGHLTTTPVTLDSVNRIESFVHAVLDAAGTMKLQGEITYRGNAAFTRRSTLAGLDGQSKKDRIKYWLFDDHASQGQLETLHIENLSDSLDSPLRIRFNAVITKYAQRSGSRLFLNPCLLERLGSEHLDGDQDRHFPYAYDYAFCRRDSLVIDLPEGFDTESMIDSAEYRSNQGEFKYEPRAESQRMNLVRKFRIFKPEIPAKDYSDHRLFIFNIIKTDRQKLVLKAI